MYWMKNLSKQENIVYLALWGVLFAAPVLSLYVRSVSDQDVTFQWADVVVVWTRFLVFLVLFLVHNFFLAPLLIHQRRRLLYSSLTVVILAVFVLYQCNTHPSGGPHGDRPPHEMGHERPPFEECDDAPAFQHADHPRPPHDRKPPVIVGEHDVVATIVLILMFGMNLGIKLFFKTRSDERKLIRLEKENLEQHLEYLKYQINPHFLMNTLNNIHALVDIDPAKAQETIVELSKMMRFILYEGSKQGVPLSREFEFITTYVNLMRLRYTERVTITMDLPTEVPDKTVPPLMLISFIENAFKHGISYQHPSFIDIRVTLDGARLHFSCRNSKADKPNEEKGGVGLQNVKKRLQLLYDDRYTLNIVDAPDTYHVELTIPLP